MITKDLKTSTFVSQNGLYVPPGGTVSSVSASSSAQTHIKEKSSDGASRQFTLSAILKSFIGKMIPESYAALYILNRVGGSKYSLIVTAYENKKQVKYALNFSVKGCFSKIADMYKAPVYSVDAHYTVRDIDASMFGPKQGDVLFFVSALATGKIMNLVLPEQLEGFRDLEKKVTLTAPKRREVKKKRAVSKNPPPKRTPTKSKLSKKDVIAEKLKRAKFAGAKPNVSSTSNEDDISERENSEDEKSKSESEEEGSSTSELIPEEEEEEEKEKEDDKKSQTGDESEVSASSQEEKDLITSAANVDFGVDDSDSSSAESI